MAAAHCGVGGVFGVAQAARTASTSGLMAAFSAASSDWSAVEPSTAAWAFSVASAVLYRARAARSAWIAAVHCADGVVWASSRETTAGLTVATSAVCNVTCTAACAFSVGLAACPVCVTRARTINPLMPTASAPRPTYLRIDFIRSLLGSPREGATHGNNAAARHLGRRRYEQGFDVWRSLEGTPPRRKRPLPRPLSGVPRS